MAKYSDMAPMVTVLIHESMKLAFEAKSAHRYSRPVASSLGMGAAPKTDAMPPVRVMGSSVRNASRIALR